MKRVCGFVMALMMALVLCVNCALSEDGVVDVVVFNNGGGVTGGISSDPDTLKTLQDWFVEKIGVRITVIVPPAEEEKLPITLRPFSE